MDSNKVIKYAWMIVVKALEGSGCSLFNGNINLPVKDNGDIECSIQSTHLLESMTEQHIKSKPLGTNLCSLREMITNQPTHIFQHLSQM
jgi:hypothetical protein